MEKMPRWKKLSILSFRRKVAATPARVLGNKTLREYFLVDFFHDAIIKKIQFDHHARKVDFEFVTCETIVPKYSRDWGVRLPAYEEGSAWFVWRCTFSHVTHFSMNALLMKVLPENGRMIKENRAFDPRARWFDYVGGRFVSSRLLAQQEREFGLKLVHLKMDCYIRSFDLIFKDVRIQRLEKAPHRWKEKGMFMRFLQS